MSEASVATAAAAANESSSSAVLSPSSSSSDDSAKKSAANKKKRDRQKKKKTEAKAQVGITNVDADAGPSISFDKSSAVSKANSTSSQSSSSNSNGANVGVNAESESERIRQNFSSLSMHSYFHEPLKLSMRYSSDKGRHIVATDSLPCGTAIFEIAPYAAVPIDDELPMRCHRCFSSAESLLVCHKCQSIRFCSTACKNALASAHVEECSILLRLKELKVDGESAPIRMLIRILAERTVETKRLAKSADVKSRGKVKGDIYKAKPGLSFADFESLISHLEDFSAQERLDLETILARLEPAFVENAEIWPGAKEAAKIVLRVQVNAHHIADDAKKKIGVALYLPAAHLNHSCRPTCIWHFDEKKNMTMKTIRAVKAGEEMTYAYVDLYSGRQKRWQQLQAVYKIDECKCERCREPFDRSPDRFVDGYTCGQDGCHQLLTNDSQRANSLYCSSCKKSYPREDYEAIDREAELLIDSGLRLFNADDREEAADYLTRLLTGKIGARLHPFHSLRFNSSLALIGIHRSLGQPEKAMHYAEFAVDALTQMKLENHPEIADIHMAIATAVLEKLQLEEETRKQSKKKQAEEKEATSIHTATSASSDKTNLTPVPASNSSNTDSTSSAQSSSTSSSSSASPSISANSTLITSAASPDHSASYLLSLCEKGISASHESIRLRDLLFGFRHSSTKTAKKLIHQLQEFQEKLQSLVQEEAGNSNAKDMSDTGAETAASMGNVNNDKKKSHRKKK